MNNKTKGIICIIASAFFFSLMSLFVRMAGDLPTMEKAFFRNAIAAAFAIVILHLHTFTDSGEVLYQKRELA